MFEKEAEPHIQDLDKRMEEDLASVMHDVRLRKVSMNDVEKATLHRENQEYFQTMLRRFMRARCDC